MEQRQPSLRQLEVLKAVAETGTMARAGQPPLALASSSSIPGPYWMIR